MIEIEYIVCELHGTWFTHSQTILEADFDEDLLLVHFNLPGDYAYIGIYSIRECEPQEEQ